jgi:hypothetical protein
VRLYHSILNTKNTWLGENRKGKLVTLGMNQLSLLYKLLGI